jgi:hypothetical protein
VKPAGGTGTSSFVYVVNGTVARIRAVDPDGTWERDDRGYADIPLTSPLTEVQAAEQFPTLGLRLGGPRPHVKGRSGSTCRYDHASPQPPSTRFVSTASPSENAD